LGKETGEPEKDEEEFTAWLVHGEPGAPPFLLINPLTAISSVL
jgi:hypothetical protein